MAKREVKSGSERDVQRRVITFLRKRKWFVVNTSGAWRSAKGMAGFPDLVAHWHGTVVYLEIKGFSINALRPAQLKWKRRLSPHRTNNILFYLVNDERYEWFEDQIRRIENDSAI